MARLGGCMKVDFEIMSADSLSRDEAEALFPEAYIGDIYLGWDLATRRDYSQEIHGRLCDGCRHHFYLHEETEQLHLLVHDLRSGQMVVDYYFLRGWGWKKAYNPQVTYRLQYDPFAA
jgi:hypothetical protein